MRIHFDADMKSVAKRLAESDNPVHLSQENWKVFTEIMLNRSAQPNDNLREMTEPSGNVG